MDAQKQVVEVPDRKGCGTAFYQEDVEKQPNGEFPLQIQCNGTIKVQGVQQPCGALLRAFGNLDNIRA
jgi:hypothetical protein